MKSLSEKSILRNGTLKKLQMPCIECAGTITMNIHDLLKGNVRFAVVDTLNKKNEVWKTGMPKGKMRPGETLIETARRETAEELNADEDRFRIFETPVFSHVRWSENDGWKNIYLFPCLTEIPEWKADEKKHFNARWADDPEELHYPEDRDMLRSILPFLQAWGKQISHVLVGRN